jgi:hypothetical protein
MRKWLGRRLMPHVLNWKDASSLPAPVTLTRDQALARLLHALSDRHPDDRSCMRQRAVATVIGRFDYERWQSDLGQGWAG